MKNACIYIFFALTSAIIFFGVAKYIHNSDDAPPLNLQYQTVESEEFPSGAEARVLSLQKRFSSADLKSSRPANSKTIQSSVDEQVEFEDEIRPSTTILDEERKCRNADLSVRIVERNKRSMKTEMDAVRRKNLEEETYYHIKIVDYCQHSGLADKESIAKAITKLARNGDSKARLKFPFIANPVGGDSEDLENRRAEFISEAKYLLNAEISAGNSDALRVMAQGYMPPPVEGMNTPFVVNPKSAYVYYYAFALTRPSEDQMSTIETILARLEASLTPLEVENGRREAAQIAACCGR